MTRGKPHSKPHSRALAVIGPEVPRTLGERMDKLLLLGAFFGKNYRITRHAKTRQAP